MKERGFPPAPGPAGEHQRALWTRGSCSERRCLLRSALGLGVQPGRWALGTLAREGLLRPPGRPLLGSAIITAAGTVTEPSLCAQRWASNC